VPVPNGQSPAIARNKVDLPQPEGPVTSACSPASMKRSSVATSGAPLGRCTDNPSIVSPVLGAAGMLSDGPALAALLAAADARAAAMERSNPSRRAMQARHSAKSRYTVMKNDSAVSTLPNAPAVCTRAPS
jgi:hypothetical protein